MPVVQLEQGSQAWLDYRKKKIMATDIPIILGSNPFKTKLELWEEKLGFRESTKINTAMERGQRLEPEARTLASHEIGTSFDPCVLEHSKYTWLAASLDGMSKGGYTIIEIKCPKDATHQDAIEGIIPPYYEDQIQVQLLVSGAGCCIFFSYRPERKDKPYAIIEVYPDHEKQAEIIEKGYKFYQDMCNMNPPEEWKFKQRT